METTGVIVGSYWDTTMRVSTLGLYWGLGF